MVCLVKFLVSFVEMGSWLVVFSRCFIVNFREAYGIFLFE